MNELRLVKGSEAARRLGVCLRTLRDHHAEMGIRAWALPGQPLKYFRADVERVAAQAVQLPEQAATGR